MTEEAFAALFEQHHGAVLAYALRLVDRLGHAGRRARRAGAEEDRRPGRRPARRARDRRVPLQPHGGVGAELGGVRREDDLRAGLDPDTGALLEYDEILTTDPGLLNVKVPSVLELTVYREPGYTPTTDARP